MSLLVLDKANTTKEIPYNFEQQAFVNSQAVIEELFELLEEYGPSWYTEEHHKRAVAALLSPWPLSVQEGARRA